nr:hypothetical protein [uncultured Acetatifactor sp.]
MKKLNHITLEHVMQSLLSKKENELLNSIIQKLNWNIDDLNHLIDNINTQKDIIYFIVLGDWIKEACTEIYKLYEKYANNFVYKENYSRKLANDKFKAIRSFIVAHPLNTSSHPDEGYNGSKKCIDIYMHIPTIAKLSRLYDNPNADFFIAYYDDLICYKYEGHMYSEIWDCAYYNIDRIEKFGKYLSKIRRKNLKDYK